MKTPAVFKQTDLDRIFKAAKRAGVSARLRPDGTVDVLTESEMRKTHRYGRVDLSNL